MMNMISLVHSFTLLGGRASAAAALQTTKRQGPALLLSSRSRSRSRSFQNNSNKGNNVRQARLFQQSQQQPCEDQTTSTDRDDVPLPSFHTLKLQIPTMEDMEEIGALLSVLASPPDVIFLDGDLGAGKTTLAKGFIWCKTGQSSTTTPGSRRMRVTSPTYLLSNTYLYQETSDDDSAPPQE
jgi:hypothetical protein